MVPTIESPQPDQSAEKALNITKGKLTAYQKNRLRLEGQIKLAIAAIEHMRMKVIQRLASPGSRILQLGDDVCAVLGMTDLDLLKSPLVNGARKLSSIPTFFLR